MKKTLFILFAGLLCMVTANATDKTVELSGGSISGGATWTNDESGNYTFTGTEKTDYVEFSLGDISGYYDLVFNIVSKSSNGNPGIQIVNGTTVLNDKTWGGTNTPKTYYLQYNSANIGNSLKISNSKLENIKLRICGQGAASTFVFSSIVLHGATMTCLSGKSIGDLTYYSGGKAATPDNLANSTISSNSVTIYGNTTGSSNNYVDIADFSTLNIEIPGITSNYTKATVRCRIWTTTDGTTYTAVSPDPSVSLTNAGTATFNLSSYKTGKPVRLNFIKPSTNTSECNYTIGNIYLMKANDPIKYYISGQKIIPSTALTAAESDASCTSIDVTGVASLADPSATSMLDLNPADFTNKNCLFIAPSAATGLTQNNVIVNTTCANLSLVDGSAFNAPSAFTATKATYTINTTSRDMTTTAGTRYGTIILPFAVSANTTYKFFTVSTASSSQLVLNEVTSTVADEPYIFRLNANAGESASLADITASSASIAVTPSSLAQNAVNGTTLTGSYTAQTISTTNAYYLGTNDKFYQSKGSLTVNPFRAYFNGVITSQAKSLTLGEFDDATSVENALHTTPLIVAAEKGNVTLLANEKTIAKIYNAGGILIRTIHLKSGEEMTVNLTSGLYLINDIKIVVK